jgi:hypothetical protein
MPQRGEYKFLSRSVILKIECPQKVISDCPACPSTGINDEEAAQVYDLAQNDNICENVNISYWSHQASLITDFGIKCVLAKFTTVNTKAEIKYMLQSCDLFKCAKTHKTFLTI